MMSFSVRALRFEGVAVVSVTRSEGLYYWRRLKDFEEKSFVVAFPNRILSDSGLRPGEIYFSLFNLDKELDLPSIAELLLVMFLGPWLDAQFDGF
jgi:hypothetical protein